MFKSHSPDRHVSEIIFLIAKANENNRCELIPTRILLINTFGINEYVSSKKPTLIFIKIHSNRLLDY